MKVMNSAFCTEVTGSKAFALTGLLQDIRGTSGPALSLNHEIAMVSEHFQVQFSQWLVGQI
jgi:hypothetical protein